MVWDHGAGLYRFDGNSYTNFTTKEGLTNDRVSCLCEDSKGNIWIGTEGGVSRYDGHSFQNFKTSEDLNDNDINSIVEDQYGTFWFGTRGRVFTFDGRQFNKFNHSDGSSFENVRMIIEDTQGKIWLGGNTGLWRFDGDTFTNCTTNFVGFIYQDNSDNIWTSSEGDDRQNWVLSRYQNTELSDKAPTATEIKTEPGMFFGILEDQKGGIWIGTLRGVYRFDGKSFDNFQQANE